MDLSELLRRFRDESFGGLHVAMPGVIVAYDAATQRCTVDPKSHVRVGADELAVPRLTDVPVCWPRAGGCTVALPLAVNDPVMIFVADRPLEGWRLNGQAVAPTDPRAHSLTDAFVVPMGIWPDAQPSPIASATDVVVGFDVGGTVRIAPDGTITIGGVGAQPVALASLVQANLQQLANVLGAWVPVPNDGGASLKVLLSALLLTGWPATPSMAATKVRAL